jgi:hypothetical protein
LLHNGYCSNVAELPHWRSHKDACGAWAPTEARTFDGWGNAALRSVYSLGPGFPQVLMSNAQLAGLVYIFLIAHKIVLVIKARTERPNFADLCPYIPDKCQIIKCQTLFLCIQKFVSFALDKLMPYFALYSLGSARSFDAGNDIYVVSVLVESGTARVSFYIFMYSCIIWLEFLAFFKEDFSSEGVRYILSAALKVSKILSWPATLCLTIVCALQTIIREVSALTSHDSFRSFWDMIPFPACFSFNAEFGIGFAASFVQFLLLLNTLTSLANDVARKMKRCKKKKAREDAAAKPQSAV